MPVRVSSAIGVYPYEMCGSRRSWATVVGCNRAEGSERWMPFGATSGAASCVSNDRQFLPVISTNVHCFTTRSVVPTALPEGCEDLTPLAF